MRTIEEIISDIEKESGSDESSLNKLFIEAIKTLAQQE